MANKRKVLLLGSNPNSGRELLSLNSRVIMITLDMKQFFQNYIQAPVSRLHSSSTSAPSFYLFHINQHSRTFLNRRPLCEVDLSSVIVTRGISVGISSAGLIARRYEIKNRKANYLNPRGDHITMRTKPHFFCVIRTPAGRI